MMMSKLMLEKQNGKLWNGFIWLRTGTNGGHCKHRNKSSGSIKTECYLE